jgi:DNA invertase Pin-like site-specific DNA recombinase
MMIGVLGSLAEYERELTKERTALKRASSRANGSAIEVHDGQIDGRAVVTELHDRLPEARRL